MSPICDESDFCFAAMSLRDFIRATSKEIRVEVAKKPAQAEQPPATQTE